MLTHSGDYWERRDGHTGVSPYENVRRIPFGNTGVPGVEGYQEVEVYNASRTDPDGRKRQIRVTRPYTYVDRYHWQIVRNQLELVFKKEELSPLAKKAALAELEPLLRKNKMWPFPADREMKQWLAEVRVDSVLDTRSKIALLQNESIFQINIAEAAPSTRYGAAALDRARQIQSVLLALGGKILSSLDVGTQSNGASAPVLRVNPAITPVLEDHLDERIRALYLELRNEPLQPQAKRRFFNYGGATGRIHRIADPQGLVPPFILSDELGDFAQWEAAGWETLSLGHKPGLCEMIGATLPTVQQLEVWARVDGAGPHKHKYWSSESLPPKPPLYNPRARYLDGSDGSMNDAGIGSMFKVRCVRPIGF